MVVDVLKFLSIPFCLIVIAYGEHTPSIIQITESQTEDVGRTLDVTCTVEHAREYPVLWVKYAKLNDTEAIPLSNNYTLVTRDQRISLRFDPASTAYTLSIKDLQETDAGWYQCQIRTENSNITADVELQIRTRPVISDNYTQSLILNEGESGKIECYATGVPTPTVYWRREYEQMFPTGEAIYRGNIVKFPSIQKEDAGIYFCVAENHVFEEDHRLIEVHMQYAPIVVIIPESRVVPTPGDSTYFTCHVAGYPPANVTWFKDETPLNNNQYISVANFITSDDFVSSFVRMDEVDESDYGNYTCKAQNKLGTAEGRVELIEPIIPVCVPPCDNETHIETTTAWRPWITSK